jgi:hypothetical protein
MTRAEFEAWHEAYLKGRGATGGWITRPGMENIIGHVVAEITAETPEEREERRALTKEAEEKWDAETDWAAIKEEILRIERAEAKYDALPEEEKLRHRIRHLERAIREAIKHCQFTAEEYQEFADHPLRKRLSDIFCALELIPHVDLAEFEDDEEGQPE